MDATDPDARLTELFESHYDEVHAYCARRIGASDADDIASEVFAVAWRRIDELEGETARSWLYGVARGVLANRWRSAHRHRRLMRKVAGLAAERERSPDVYVVQRDQDREVIEALRKLRSSDQEVLMLAAWEGLTAPQIAHAMSITTSAAEQRLHRAKKRFAKVLDRPPLKPLSPRAAQEGGGQ